MNESIYDTLENMRWYSWVKETVLTHPGNGYLIVAGLLTLWLFGVIMGWKWTYEANSWKQNTLREMLGAGMYRFCIGAILAVSIGITLYLYFITEK